MQVLKARVPDVGFKPFPPHGEAQGCESPSYCGSLNWAGDVHGKIVSQPLLSILMWVCLFAQRVGATQLVFEFLSEDIVLYVAVDSVCL